MRTSDPYLAEVADRHGSRLALVGLHPLDGQDGVATAASEARLDRWRAVHDNLNQTPAFLVEGEAPLVGPEVWPDVTRRMLELESSRPADGTMSLTATREGDVVHLSITGAPREEGRQLTLMLLDHGRALRPMAWKQNPAARTIASWWSSTPWQQTVPGAASVTACAARPSTGQAKRCWPAHRVTRSASSSSTKPPTQTCHPPPRTAQASSNWPSALRPSRPEPITGGPWPRSCWVAAWLWRHGQRNRRIPEERFQKKNDSIRNGISSS